MAMQARHVQMIIACNLIARLTRSKPSVNFSALGMLTCAAFSGQGTQPSFNQPWSETTRQPGSLAHCRQPEGPADRAAIAGAERRSEIVRRPAPTNDSQSRCANAIPQRYRDSHRNPLETDTGPRNTLTIHATARQHRPRLKQGHYPFERRVFWEFRRSQHESWARAFWSA